MVIRGVMRSRHAALRTRGASRAAYGGAALLLAAPLLACRPARGDPQPPEPRPAKTPRKDPAPAQDGAIAKVPPPSARTTASGVAIDVLEPGDASAATPRSGDLLELRYRVWDEDGRIIGASRPGRSERLATTWLPPGWAEAMYTLHPGAHAHLWIPAAVAYETVPGGPRGELRIDVHLIALETPSLLVEDLPIGTPPPNALYTASGIAFVVLRSGTGIRHATPDSRVTVHYEGWTSDGKRFDSSYERGKPTTFPLPAVISGWQEAVPLMVEGEKTRFWIPEDLAYGQKPGKPNGMLTFDIELVKIED